MKTLFALALLLTTTFGGTPLTADANLNGSLKDGICTVDIACRNLPTVAVGGQFFVRYDPAVLTFVSAEPVSPFSLQIYENVSNGVVAYACGIPSGGSGTQSDSVFARLTFERTKAECTSKIMVDWTEGPNGAVNMLSSDQAEAITLTTNTMLSCE